MNRLRKLLILLIVASIVTVGCGRKTVAIKKNELLDDDSIVVGVSQVGSESVWRSANTKAIQNVFTKENGYVLIFDNARQKQENQMKAIRSFIALDVDYIVVSPITEDGWETILREAKEAGIPVILMDRKVDVLDRSLYTCWVGSDFYLEGKKAGRWLEEYLDKIERDDEVLNLVTLEGTNGSTSQLGRSRGFMKVAGEHDNWHMLECVDAEFTTAKAKEEMARLLEEYEDIDVVVSQNDDMTFGALEAIHEAGKTTGSKDGIIIISYDGVKRALEMVEKNIINVDIECNPKQAEVVSKIIMKMEAGEAVGKEYFVEEMVFTPKNVSKYIDERTY